MPRDNLSSLLAAIRFGYAAVCVSRHNASLEFEQLDEIEFQEFCYELLQEIGFVNVD